MAQLKMNAQAEPTDDNKNHLYPSLEDLLLHYKNSDNVDGIIPRVFVKSTAPTVDDDSDSGYIKTDIWQDDVGKKIYTLNDATVGAAVWIAATVSSLAADDVTVADSDDLFNSDNAEDALEELAEKSDYNGFDRLKPATMPDATFDYTIRTLSVSVKSGSSSFHFWSANTKKIKTSTDTIVIPDISGLYYFYYDEDGVLQYILDADVTSAMFNTYAIVSQKYWNADFPSADMFNEDEMHGKDMSGATHESIHMTAGARHSFGGGINGLSNGGTTYTGTDTSLYYDEDIPHIITANTTGHKWLYRWGANGYWRTTAADLNVGYKESGDTYYSYNQWDGTNWIWKEGTSSSDYYIGFQIETPNGIAKLMSQNAYSSRSNAREAIYTEIQKMVTDGLPSSEITWLRAWIVKRTGALVALDDGSLYLDLTQARGGGSSVSGHDAVTLDTAVADYLSINGQEITLEQIDLTTDVQGILPLANGGGYSTAAGAATALDFVPSTGGDFTGQERVIGSSDEVQRWTQAHSTQTADTNVLAANSSGVKQVYVDSNFNLRIPPSKRYQWTTDMYIVGAGNTISLYTGGIQGLRVDSSQNVVVSAGSLKVFGDFAMSNKTPQAQHAYIASPTNIEIRDILISFGFMASS